MSKYFPDVESIEGASQASKWGAYSTLAFSASLCLGIAATVAGIRQFAVAPSNLIATLAGIGIELTVALSCAWRFWIKKGAFIGPIILLIFAAEQVMKVLSGTTNFGWMLFFLGLGAGIINGIRAAWAFRAVRKGDREWLEPLLDD